MSDLILIRHGEAEGQGRYLGRRSNPPLSPGGREQVLLLGERLKADGILPETCKLFSSPQRRALETAGILTGTAPLVIDELAEMDFGDWDGLSWEEISESSPVPYREWLDDPVGKAPPDGESLRSFSRRVEAGLERILKTGACRAEADKGPIIITAHGGTIRAVIYSLLNLDMERPWLFTVDCASYSRLKLYDGDASAAAVLVKLNVR